MAWLPVAASAPSHRGGGRGGRGEELPSLSLGLSAEGLGRKAN